MSSYRVIALSQEAAAAVRVGRVSPFAAHPTHVEVATGYGPCRLCLRTFTVGVDRRILLTYDPFVGTESLPLPGPVFIHEGECDRYPEDAGFPNDIRELALTLNAYAPGRRLMAVEYLRGGNVDETITRLLARPDVDYIHVRDTTAGCFECRIER